MAWRHELEQLVLGAGGLVVRPVFVHGHGSGDILLSLIDSARRNGHPAYPDPGTNPWATVHVDDVGTAIAAALATAPDESSFNLAAGETTPKQLTTHIGALLDVPVEAIAAERAVEEVPYARWLGGSFHVDCDRAREVLGWRPAHADILDDLAATYIPARDRG